MNKLLSEALFKAHVAYFSDERLLAERNWVIHKAEYPIVEISFRDGERELRLRFNCDNWNELPPSIELIKSNGDYLDNIPQGHGVFNSSPHSNTKRPFICMIGSREYHTHSGHVNDVWENYKDKSSYTLGGIITQIWRAWKKTT